jgi:hypothetical protein
MAAARPLDATYEVPQLTLQAWQALSRTAIKDISLLRRIWRRCKAITAP